VRDERTISSTPILYHLRWISIEPLPFYHPQYGSADFNSTEKVLLSIANEKTYSLYIYPLKTKSVSKVAIYARVSTNRQDPDRQVRELESFVDREYPDADLERYVDIISGTTDGGGKEYQRLRDDIAVDELRHRRCSRAISPLTARWGEIHDFIQHALEHDTSVRDLEVASLDVDDSMVDQAVTQMIANLMGRSRSDRAEAEDSAYPVGDCLC